MEASNARLRRIGGAACRDRGMPGSRGNAAPHANVSGLAAMYAFALLDSFVTAAGE
jgi:hypothetical protein